MEDLGGIGNGCDDIYTPWLFEESVCSFCFVSSCHEQRRFKNLVTPHECVAYVTVVPDLVDVYSLVSLFDYTSGGD